MNEQLPPKSPEISSEQRHFTYVDYRNKQKVIFECDAAGILEADALYTKATGKDPAKQSDVGCMVSKIKQD